MKRKILSICCSCMLSVLILKGFTSCKEQVDDGKVQLEAFGPSPALRGGELRFIGKNMHKVSEIVLPENISVKEISKISDSEIRILIPKETTGGNRVILKTPHGDIRTKTLLSISEPIAVKKVYKTGSESETSVIAGDEITIEGDYLNLVKEVIFVNNVTLSLNREEGQDYPQDIIKVQVPIEAQTGEITVSNGAEIPIYVMSKEILTIALPSVTALSHTKVEPLTKITITGTNLHLVKQVKFTPNLKVEIPAPIEPFKPINEIKVVVPEATLSGNVTLIAYSGIEVEAGTLEVSTPMVSSELPLKANIGDDIKLEGHNLEHIQAIFINDLKITTFKTQTADSIVFTIPEGTKLGEGTLKFVDQGEKIHPINGKIEITNIERIKPTDLMFMDFEPHGEHDGSWDISWSGVTQLMKEDNNAYMRISKPFGLEQWVINCNHQDRGALIPIISDVTQYVMKIDMKAEKDFTIGTTNEFTFVVAKNWAHKSETVEFFPLAEDKRTCTTGGGWITVTIELSKFGFTSGSLDLSKVGDTGLFVKTSGMDPTGLCFDNWRFSKK